MTSIEENRCKTLLFEEQTPQPGSRSHSPIVTTCYMLFWFKCLMSCHNKCAVHRFCLGEKHISICQYCLCRSSELHEMHTTWFLTQLGNFACFHFHLPTGVAHLTGQQSIRLWKYNAISQWQCSSVQRDLWNSFSKAPKSERTVFVWLRSTFKYSPVVVHCKEAWTLLRSTCELTHVRGLDPELMILNGFNLQQSTRLTKVSTLAPNIQTAPGHRKLFCNKVPLEEQPGLAALAQPRVCAPVYCSS